MNFGSLVAKVAHLAPTAKAANDVLKAALNAIVDELYTGGQVTLRGFGRFRLSDAKDRNGSHPVSHTPMTIKGKARILFKQSKATCNRKG